MEEHTQHGFLEEILAAYNWNDSSAGLSNWSEALHKDWNLFDTSFENPILANPSPPFASLSTSVEHSFHCLLGSEATYSYRDAFMLPDINSPYTINDVITSLPMQEDNLSLVEDDHGLGFLRDENRILPERNSGYELEMQGPTEYPEFNMGLCSDKSKKANKLEGQPSKNLMAERRRRKRLNDRLSMLRSIVPKISKMDRTSILGDTIDYVKELKEKISKLQQGVEGEATDEINSLFMCKQMTPDEAIVKNSPKFDVERKDLETRISIACEPRPGLLLSTVNTLEALGLEVNRCVTSCFNDFSMQASCSEVGEQRTVTSNEDIKQALFRNAQAFGTDDRRQDRRVA